MKMYVEWRRTRRAHSRMKSVHVVLLAEPQYQSIKLLILLENVSQAILQLKASQTLHN